LVAANEKSDVYKAPTIAEAMQTLVASHIFSFVRYYFAAPDSTADKAKYAVFRLKSAQMAEIYDTVFSELALQYKVTLVAGSICCQSRKSMPMDD